MSARLGMVIGFCLTMAAACGGPAEGERLPAAGGDSAAAAARDTLQASDTAAAGDSTDTVEAAAEGAEPPCVASRIGLPCADP